MFSLEPDITEEAQPEFDPVAMIQKAIAADLDPAVFSEKTFDVAPNVIEWCRGHQWLNASMDLFPRQVEMLARFFADVCYMCSDVEYIHNVPVDEPSVDEVLDHFVLLHHGVCPKCGRNRTEMLDAWQKDLRYGRYNQWDQAVKIRPVPPNEFNGIWGQRSSKSFFTSSFIMTYLLHRALAIPSLTRYYRMPSNVVLEAAIVAPTLKQIEKNMWMPFRNAYDGSPWFRDMIQYLKGESKRVGIELYHQQQTFIVFPSKRLVLQMLAANSSNLRGSTRIFGCQDEWGWFNVSEDGKKRSSVRDGTEVFIALNNSLRTVRSRAEKRRRQGDYNALDGYMITISSPSSIADPIETRAAAAPKSFRMMHTRYATWEVNPEESEELICEEFAGDPVKLKRDFYAQPPRAVSPFIEPTPLLKEVVDPRNKRLFSVEIVERRDGDIALLGAERITSDVTLLGPKFKQIVYDRAIPRVLTVDNGEKKNSFALCVARYYPEQTGMLIEELIEILPRRKQQIDLAACYNDLVVPLVKSFSFLHVAYDRWESAFAVRDLRSNYGIDAQRYSLVWKDFSNFKEDLLGMRVWHPQPEIDPDELLRIGNNFQRSLYPRAHYQVQLTTVNEFGKKVTKPDGGNDDLFRVVVLAHRFIKQYHEQYRHNVRAQGGNREKVAVFYGRSQRQSAGAAMGNRAGRMPRQSNMPRGF